MSSATNDETSAHVAPAADQWRDLLFSVRRSVRYHLRRQTFFERAHMLTNIAAILCGTTAIATVLETVINTKWVLASAGFVSAIAIIDIIIGTARKSWIHGDLARQFRHLEKDMVTTLESEEAFKEFTIRRLDIEMEEPALLHVLNVMSHNEVMMAMGRPREEFARVFLYQKILAHFFDAPPFGFPPIGGK